MMEELRRMTDVTFGSRPNKTEFCPASDPKTDFSGHQHFSQSRLDFLGISWQTSQIATILDLNQTSLAF